MIIYIALTDYVKLPLDVDPMNTISSVLTDMTGIRAIYNGQQLEADRTLDYYNIRDGCEILILENYNGACRPDKNDK